MLIVFQFLSILFSAYYTMLCKYIDEYSYYQYKILQFTTTYSKELG